MLMIIKCSNCDYEDFSLSDDEKYLICKRCNEEIFIKGFEYNYDLLDKKHMINEQVKTYHLKWFDTI